MSDLFGHAPPSRPFKDIRKQRDSVAERKAELVLELGGLIRDEGDALLAAPQRHYRPPARRLFFVLRCHGHQSNVHADSIIKTCSTSHMTPFTRSARKKLVLRRSGA